MLSFYTAFWHSVPFPGKLLCSLIWFTHVNPLDPVWVSVPPGTFLQTPLIHHFTFSCLGIWFKVLSHLRQYSLSHGQYLIWEDRELCSTFYYRVPAHIACHTTGQSVERWDVWTRNHDFIQKTRRRRRWQTSVPKIHLTQIRIQSSVLKGEEVWLVFAKFLVQNPFVLLVVSTGQVNIQEDKCYSLGHPVNIQEVKCYSVFCNFLSRYEWKCYSCKSQAWEAELWERAVEYISGLFSVIVSQLLPWSLGCDRVSVNFSGRNEAAWFYCVKSPTVILIDLPARCGIYIHTHIYIYTRTYIFICKKLGVHYHRAEGESPTLDAVTWEAPKWLSETEAYKRSLVVMLK